MMRTSIAGALVAASALCFSAAVHSQAYPAKPLKLIVPFGAGGSGDVYPREIARKLGAVLGQPIVVENRVGAAGNIGAEAVAKSAPDGYTILLLTSTHAINATLYQKLTYSLLRDFSPTALGYVVPSLLVVNANVPIESVKQLIDKARAQPGKLSYASAGSGTTQHLQMELLKTMAGVDILHVPYGDSNKARTDVVSGQVNIMLDYMFTANPLIRSQKFRALGISSRTRLPSLPDLPTIAEAGVPGYEAYGWVGFAVPMGTPTAIIHRLNAEIVKILRLPDILASFEKGGLSPGDTIVSSAEEFTAFVRSDVEKWAKVVRMSGAKVE